MEKTLSHTEISQKGELKENANPNNMTYKTFGFREAGKIQGDIHAFRISLDKFYSNLITRADANSQLYKEKKHNTENEVSRLEKEIENNNSTISSIKSGRLQDVKTKIENIRKEIREVNVNPQKYVNNETDRFQYYLYLSLLVCLTLFLFVFYSSVVYSAFFRVVNLAEENVFNSIFYPEALTKALENFSVAMIVFSAPFIFMSLGMLIAQVKKITKIVFMVSTFLFDGLLAYHISKRLHDIESLNSYGNVTSFNLINAFVDANFWLVIFFGFVVYLILGKIFEKFNEERSYSIKLKRIINEKEKEIEELEKKEAAINTEIAKIEDEINEKKKSIAAKTDDYEKIYYSPTELKRIFSEYALGWILYLKNGNHKPEMIASIQEALTNFYQTKGIN